MYLDLPATHTDTQGRHYPPDTWHVRKDPVSGPGWFIFGRADNVSASVVTRIARPASERVKHRSYNAPVYIGWRTKYAAMSALGALKQWPYTRNMGDAP